MAILKIYPHTIPKMSLHMFNKLASVVISFVVSFTLIVIVILLHTKRSVSKSQQECNH